MSNLSRTSATSNLPWHRSLQAFEIDRGDDSKFSFVFALGALFWEFCFYHNIFLACMQRKVEDRPTRRQLRAMHEAIGMSED